EKVMIEQIAPTHVLIESPITRDIKRHVIVEIGKYGQQIEVRIIVLDKLQDLFEALDDFGGAGVFIGQEDAHHARAQCISSLQLRGAMFKPRVLERFFMDAPVVDQPAQIHSEETQWAAVHLQLIANSLHKGG